MHRMIRPTTDKEPTMTDITTADADKLAQRVTENLEHFATRWTNAATDVRTKLAKDLSAGTYIGRVRFEHAMKVEAFGGVAHWVEHHTGRLDLLADVAADRMMDDPDADARAAWATVLRITLGK